MNHGNPGSAEKNDPRAKAIASELKILEQRACDASGRNPRRSLYGWRLVGSIDNRIRISRTARYFDMETAAIGKDVTAGPAWLYGVRNTATAVDHVWRRDTLQKYRRKGDRAVGVSGSSCRQRRESRQSCAFRSL